MMNVSARCAEHLDGLPASFINRSRGQVQFRAPVRARRDGLTSMSACGWKQPSDHRRAGIAADEAARLGPCGGEPVQHRARPPPR